MQQLMVIFIFLSIALYGKAQKQQVRFSNPVQLFFTAETKKPIGIAHTAISFLDFEKKPVKTIPKNYIVSNYGFFCRKELQFEKNTKIPLRFRLGSLDYCNKLEGK